MPQRDLFDNPPPLTLCDPKVTEAERPRLSRQCQAILDRLQRGPALNTELVAIALKYTGRLSDLRKNGYVIVCKTVDAKAGLFSYELETPKEG